MQPITLNNIRGIQNDKEQFREFFETCFHLYYEGLHRYAYTIVKDNHEAGDIVQIAFTKFWEQGGKLVIRQDIRHYLYRTIHNQCLNHNRNKRNRKTYAHDFSGNPEAIAHPEIDDPIITKEMIDKVHRELKNLPPQCKRIFYKSRLEGKKYAEIASELNLSIKTVEAQMGRALNILRQKIFEDNFRMLFLVIYFVNKIF